MASWFTSESPIAATDKRWLWSSGFVKIESGDAL